ncbi:hypothetical protein [Nostoc sp. DedQUE02]|nr:hypothetical protein [Nostoc sp. DedQUE03]MDZ7977188.1 hypothetical protein [Nostoc sp. DedQUE03]MDZ8042715.1 hypothetical protein [Nostoc sp. DedQUE02]
MVKTFSEMGKIVILLHNHLFVIFLARLFADFFIKEQLDLIMCPELLT